MLDDQAQGGVGDLERQAPHGEQGATADPPARLPARAVTIPVAKRVALGMLAVAALAGAIYYGRYWWSEGRYLVTTDDAYVGARSATLSPKISGYLVQVEVEDNALVKAGDVIARIDD